MIERIAPDGVRCHSLRDTTVGDTTAGYATVGDAVDDPDAVVALLPQEEEALGPVARVRRRDFARARHCARAALADLGHPATPVLVGPDREPIWPDGVVGSITHCQGYWAAGVARARDLASFGIDAEPAGPLPVGVRRRVMSATEAGHLTTLPDGTCWDRVLFSAKESVYKAWFPLTGGWLGFGDVELVIEAGAGSFYAALRVPGPVRHTRAVAGFQGRFLVRDGLVVTAAWPRWSPVRSASGCR